MAEQGRRGGRTAGGVGNLAGGGPSIVGVSGAMRARDASRIRPEHVEAAERTVVLRRRPYEPDRPLDFTRRHRTDEPAPTAPDDTIGLDH